ncbi:MAG: metal-dependent transcriptional regulator [Brumimicrobium sp.]
MIGLTQGEENYLKAIYHLQKLFDGPVKTNDLAKKINTKASSATDMIRRLADKSLVLYEKYQGCTLTRKGEKEALKTIRKHRLWETFLVEKLNFGWEEVHEIAEQLEHIQSVELTNRLDAFLNFPKFDPHGDPIPNIDGEVLTRTEISSLAELKVGTKAKIVGVYDSSSSFLQYLDKYQIGLGDEIIIKERFDFDNSCEVLFKGKTLNFSASVASKLRVQIQ